MFPNQEMGRFIEHSMGKVKKKREDGISQMEILEKLLSISIISGYLLMKILVSNIYINPI